MTLRNTHSKQQHTHTTPEPLSLRLRVHPGYNSLGWTTWWLWRGARTRSHPELGRENPQRPWYCVLRHGRVGRRQVFQPRQNKHSEPYTIQPSAHTNAGWSSPVARQAHNLKVRGSNPLPATKFFNNIKYLRAFLLPKRCFRKPSGRYPCGWGRLAA